MDVNEGIFEAIAAYDKGITSSLKLIVRWANGKPTAILQLTTDEMDHWKDIAVIAHIQNIYIESDQIIVSATSYGTALATGA